MSEANPYRGPEPTATVKANTKKLWLSPLEWIVVAIIIAVLLALLLPAVRNGGTPSRRTQCKNNLKQIGLALHNYHDRYLTFPPAVVYDETGRQMHSWRVLILPYIDEQKLYDKYRMDEAWNGPNNILLLDQMPRAYRCPSFLPDVEKKSPLYQHLAGLTNYVLVVSPDAAFYGNTTPNQKSVTDGGFQTIMTVDVKQHAVQWSAPEDVTPGQLLTDLRMSVNEGGGNHAKGLHAGFVDGSVRFMPHDMPEADFHAMITSTAGDTVSDGF